MNNQELLDLSRRLRAKSAILLDADFEFATDLIYASFALDSLLEAREAVDAAIAECIPCTR
jgi:hypothetical protein